MKTIFNLICVAYATILRTLIVKAIDDPNSEVDEFVLERLDALFNYKQTEK